MNSWSMCDAALSFEVSDNPKSVDTLTSYQGRMLKDVTHQYLAKSHWLLHQW